ncbi:ABC transporter ATP-binding protein [Ferrimonas pelagia]|uniref:ATP-binding cassette domain-containing protein n=1 Tax=Ferrimonas pelagia TaxID=1177826 RepID=A0ABP9EDE9_9GAMM
MITLSQLGFGYGAQAPLFQNVSLTIPTGRCVALLGANGQGKSTLLKLLAGALTPKSGNLRVLDEIPRQRSPQLYQQLFFVPDQLELPPISGQRYLDRFGLFYPGFDAERCAQLLTRFEVDPSNTLTELSLGQCKKFYLAFALSSGCRLLLLDEPTNGLDIPAKAVLRDWIARHLDDEQTVLIATHQIKDIDASVDALLLLAHGGVHWFDLWELPKSVAQSIGPQAPEHSLYHESRAGLCHALVPARGTPPCEIDLELLFNAFHHNFTGMMVELEPEAA